MFIVTIWWFVSAHKWFKGPKVNIEHMMLGRGESIEGTGPLGDIKDRDDSSGDAQVPDKLAQIKD
jgi:hypothetical protein